MTTTPQYRVKVGERQDGSPVYATSSSPVCENCEGVGRYYFEAGYAPWEKAGWVECECCHGSGCGKQEDE